MWKKMQAMGYQVSSFSFENLGQDEKKESRRKEKKGQQESRSEEMKDSRSKQTKGKII